MTITVTCTNPDCTENGIAKQAEIPDQTTLVFCSCGAQLNPPKASS